MGEFFREASPMHFLFRIESFSLLSKNGIGKYESNEFERGGYKWRLSLYPNGNKNENAGDSHISLYLKLVDSTDRPAGWELNVFFKLFLFDQIQDRYLFQGDMHGKTKRFHEMKKVWGFSQFVSLSKFNNPKNGYLVGDICTFGAEVFIAKPPENIQCLSMMKEGTTVSYSWKIENFSNIKVACLYSEKFKVGDHNWRVEIFPKGFDTGKDNSVSLFLYLSDCDENPALQVFAYYKLCVKDQINGKHIEYSASENDRWFNASARSRGWHKFIGLSEMNEQGKGYLVKDTCIVEAEVRIVGVVSKRQKLS